MNNLADYLIAGDGSEKGGKTVQKTCSAIKVQLTRQARRKGGTLTLKTVAFQL
jgi:hypothetical protein